MTGDPRAQRIVRFGVFEADLRSGELRKRGLKIKLPGQAFRILESLLERPGDLVTREELRERLWSDRGFGDFEHGLNKAVNRLRGALSDIVANPRFVETVPGRGYRFIAPVFPPEPAPAARAQKLRLAVLPFENLSADPAQEYLSDGLTEELISQLGRLDPQRLGVIARTSAMKYKGARKSVDQIGEELRLDYIVEGSVRHLGQQVRIAVQLVQVCDQTHRWAESYDREAAELFRLQQEVAEKVARSLALELLPEFPGS